MTRVAAISPEALQRYHALLTLLAETGSSLIAFSGGVDSTLLVHAAKEVLGDKAVAATIAAPHIPKWEVREARQLAESLGTRHLMLEMPFPEVLRMNPPDHCYTCKTILFRALLQTAQEHSLDCVLDGTNVDDLGDYRPGLKALNELDIISPLKDAGLTKQDIRDLSRHFGLPTWDKPSFACLLSRMEIGRRVKGTDLQRVEQAEVFLMKNGFPAVRVRTHGDVARIEVPAHQVAQLAAQAERINRQLKELGYRHVTVDLAGYSMGSQNRILNDEDTP